MLNRMIWLGVFLILAVVSAACVSGGQAKRSNSDVWRATYDYQREQGKSHEYADAYAQQVADGKSEDYAKTYAHGYANARIRHDFDEKKAHKYAAAFGKQKSVGKSDDYADDYDRLSAAHQRVVPTFTRAERMPINRK